MKKAGVKSRAHKKVKANRSMPWHYFLLMILCIGVMTAGFFFTAVQHFSAIDLSIKNSEMRARISKMEAESRRLKLEREIAGSPAEIRKTAKKMGFREFNATAEFASLKSDDSQTAIEQQEIKPLENVIKSESASTADNKKASNKIDAKPEAVKAVKPVTKPIESKKQTEPRTERKEIAKIDTRSRNVPNDKHKISATSSVSAANKKIVSTASVNTVRSLPKKNESIETRPRRVK